VQARGDAYDPARAKKLLAEAGYKGERIRITTNNRKSAPSFNIAVVIQAMLQEVGVAVDLDVVEWATHMDRFLKGNYQVMVHSYSSRFDPALSFEHFTGPRAASRARCGTTPRCRRCSKRRRRPRTRASAKSCSTRCTSAC
jgi:peptide/nickel transport system substrate-binding protein